MLNDRPGSGDESYMLQCDNCGFHTGEQIEFGLHSFECDYLQPTVPNRDCSECIRMEPTTICGLDSKEFCRIIKDFYPKMATFKKNLFSIPGNKAGKIFLERYIESLEWYLEEGPKKHISWWWNSILPCLCLQIKDNKAKARINTCILKERLIKIESGQLGQVMREALDIQRRLSKKKAPKIKGPMRNWITAAKQSMQSGETKKAARIIEENDENDPNHANEDDQMFELVKEMFPKRQKLNSMIPIADPYATGLGHTDQSTIRKAIEKLQGTGGVSHFDAKQLRRVMNVQVFSGEAKRLIYIISEICSNISGVHANEESTRPLRAVRIVAIPKKSGGVRPIGIGESLRRVITKVLAWRMKKEVKEATGSMHASGLQGACEAAISAVQEEYESGKSILIMDAKNAFSNLNRDAALLTASRLVPNAYQTLLNFYNNSTYAYYKGKPIIVEEGTVQGCSLASHFYDLGVKMLSEEMKSHKVKQIWICDDLTAIGDAKDLKIWRDKIETVGVNYGYITNPSKCYVVTKDEHARQVFSQEISERKVCFQDGTRYLGAPIGSLQYRDDYTSEKLAKFNNKLRKLSRMAKTCPHSALLLYHTHIKHEITYILRTCDVQQMINDTEIVLKDLAEQIVGSKINTVWKAEEISLPIKWGGLSINISGMGDEASEQRNRSKVFTEELKNKLLAQDFTLPQPKNNKDANRFLNLQIKEKASKLVERGENKADKQRMIENQMKGTGTWINCQPIKAYGNYLSKVEFHDAVRLRMGLPIIGMARKCGCGKSNDVIHATNCKNGPYVDARHNNIRDLLHKKAKQVFADTEIEPKLQDIGEETLPRGANVKEGARADIRIKNYLRPQQNAYFDVQVINVQSQCHENLHPKNAMRRCKEKKDKFY